MSSSPVDMKGLAAQQLVKRMASQGPQAQDPGQSGKQLSEQMSQLAGADPQMLTKAVEQIKSMAGAMYTKTMFVVPEASKHLSKIVDAANAALKALEQAAATTQAVQPIVNQAGMSQPQPQQGSDQDPWPFISTGEGVTNAGQVA